MKNKLIKDGHKLLKKLKKKCKSKYIEDLEKMVPFIIPIGCDTLPDTKANLLEQTENILIAILNDCPDQEDIIKEMIDLIRQGTVLKCGGPG
jgi:hypothetical protein